MSDLGEKISKLRENKGWDIRKLAREADINHETLRKIELGATKNPGHETLKKIAKALNVKVEDLDERNHTISLIRLRNDIVHYDPHRIVSTIINSIPSQIILELIIREDPEALKHFFRSLSIDEQLELLGDQREMLVKKMKEMAKHDP